MHVRLTSGSHLSLCSDETNMREHDLVKNGIVRARLTKLPGFRVSIRRRLFYRMLLIIPILLIANCRTWATCRGQYYNTVTHLGAPLKAFWCMNETGTPGVMADASGNNQNGKYGAPANVTLGVGSLVNDGTGNTAVSFDGSGSYLATVQNSAAIALTNFTLVFWYKSAGTVANYALPVSMDGEATSSPGWELQRDSGELTGYLRVDTSTSTNNVTPTSDFPKVFDGTRHMIAIGYTNTNNTTFISIDGAPYKTAIYINLAAPVVALYFGRGSVTAKLSGGVYQDAAIFSGQLSEPNLATLYKAGTVPAIHR